MNESYMFSLDVGESEIRLPHELKVEDIDAVRVIDLRKREFTITKTSWDEFKEFAPRKGFPIYYATWHKMLKLWPVLAHRWTIKIVLRNEPERTAPPMITDKE